MIPRIDLSALSDRGAPAAAVGETLAELRRACSEVGFATVVGHGVPVQAIEDVDRAARHFFDLPEQDKRSVAPRPWNPGSDRSYRGYFPSSAAGKEGLDIGDPEFVSTFPSQRSKLLARPYYEFNRFPDEMGDEFQNCVAAYYAALSKLGHILLGAMARSLGGSAARLDEAFRRPLALSTLRFNYYPPSAEPAETSKDDEAPLACEEHTDSGIVTILYQDQRGGLQVRAADGSWRDVPHDPQAFVVNTGKALDRMTAGAFRATPHRVLHSEDERLSIPFFFEPKWDAPISGALLGLEPAAASDSNAGAKVESYEEFLQRRLRLFAEYDRSPPP